MKPITPTHFGKCEVLGLFNFGIIISCFLICIGHQTKLTSTLYFTVLDFFLLRMYLQIAYGTFCMLVFFVEMKLLCCLQASHDLSER